MKKRIYTAAGLFSLPPLWCLAAAEKKKVPESEFATADEAKEALTSAETIEIYFDLYGSKRKTKIVADGKVAGYLQKNTVYINEEEWFSIDYVEDEPINDREGSGTTYGYYDASGTCLGYAQEQYVDTSYGKDTRLIFLDVDENAARLPEFEKRQDSVMMKMTRRSAAERSGDQGSVFLTSGTRIFTVPSLRPRRTARGRLISWTGWRRCGVWSAITAQLTTILSTPACRFMKRLPLFLC